MHEAPVERGVVADEDRAVQASHKPFDNEIESRGIGDHRVADAVDPLGVHRPLRVDEGVPLVDNLAVGVAAHDRELDDAVVTGRQPSCLDIDDAEMQVVETHGCCRGIPGPEHQRRLRGRRRRGRTRTFVSPAKETHERVTVPRGTPIIHAGGVLRSAVETTGVPVRTPGRHGQLGKSDGRGCAGSALVHSRAGSRS